MSKKTKLKSLFVDAVALTGLAVLVALAVDVGNVESLKSWMTAKVDCRLDGLDARVECRAESGVQLWEGGPYWATCNVGATKPEEAGYYFWWGDTEGYVYKDNAWVSVKDGKTAIAFSASDATANSTYGKSNDTLLAEGWIDGSGNLTMGHDAARANLGGSWRMPTQAEIDQFVNNTTHEWKMQNGVEGCLVTGTNGKSIFLPLIGWGHDAILDDACTFGNYWSSTPRADSSCNARIFLCDPATENLVSFDGSRFYGYPVRAVRGFVE